MGGKNSVFRKPLGKNSDVSKVASAVLKPARGAIDATEALAKGDLDKAKNYTLGAVGNLNPTSMLINSSSSARKALSSTGFTDQLVQMTDYNNKLSSGKNLNWNEIRGYAGGAAETAAYLYGGYAVGSAAGFWGGSSGASAGAFGSQGSYLGASTSFGSTTPGITSASQFGLSGSGVLTGSGAQAASTGYLGASTSLGTTAAASSGFLSKAGGFLGETAKTLGAAYVSAAVQGQRTPTMVGVEGGGSESFQPIGMPVYGRDGQVIQGGMDFSNFMPIIVIGGLIFAGIAAFKG